MVKASELIEKLKEMIDKHGNLPVTGEGGWPVKVQFLDECPDMDDPKIVYPAEISVC